MPVSRRQFFRGSAAALLAGLTDIRTAAADEAERTAAMLAESRGHRMAIDDYSLAPDILYLNHASIGTIPRRVQKAHAGYLELCETNPWLYMWSDPWRDQLDNVRGKAARLFGCSIDEIAIQHNTTECFNLLASGLPLGPGDEVLYSNLNHGGASLCWENRAARAGYSVRAFDFPVGDLASLSAADIVGRYETAIGPNTRLLALPHIDNMVGLRHPLKEIASMAHEKGVEWVAVDGAQSANMIGLDLEDTGVDVFATSAHKWTQSPKGLGITFINRKTQADLTPMSVTWGQRIWSDSARRYEDYGTRALAAYMALGDALDFQEGIAMEAREAHHRELWSEMQAICDASDSLEFRSSRSWELSGALYAVEVRGVDAPDVSASLYEDRGMVMRPFSTPELNAVRISPNLINSTDDLARFAEAAARL